MKSLCCYLIITVLIFGTSCNGGDENTTTHEKTLATVKHKYIRYNVNSPKGQKAMAAMQKAMDSMRKMDCANVISWYYQGAMHWIPDTINNNQLCTSYANKSQLKKAWDNCTHIPGIEINFLAWHRLYIWHLEQIVRKLSGDAEFALPYWGYTDTTNTETNRTMNQVLRTNGSSLFEKSRYQELNNGVPINGGILKALNLRPLMRKKDVYLFTQAIDNAPHGAMHNYIGAGNASTYNIFNPIYNCNCNNTGPANDTCSGGLMANVPSAGFDPVFFLHHSNIDRIWQQWTNTTNGKLITADDLKAYPWGYVFFNADGSEKNYNADEVIAAIYNVDYEYDDTPTPAAAPDSVQPKKQPSVFLASKKFADTVVSKKIGKVMKGSTLSFTVANDTKKMTTLMKSANTKDAKALIVMLKVSFAAEPKGIYHVYINLPKGQANDVNSDYFAGFMTFFGAKHHAQHMAGNNITAGRAEKTFLFEMTDQFSLTNAAAKGSYDISIVNEDGKGLADITIESVAVIAK